MPSSFVPPAHGILIALLITATLIDQRSHRIPNLISLGGVVISLLLAVTGFGEVSILPALGGLTLGFAAFLPMYAKGWMGAGDVKLVMAVGAFLGPALALGAVLGTFMAGAVLGIGVLAVRDGPGETFGRYAFGLKHLVLGGSWLGSRPNREGSGQPLRFPYAAAITCGALSALLFSGFWMRLWGGQGP